MTITSFPIGIPGGQIPSVHVRDFVGGADLYTLNADTISNYPASCIKLMTLLLIYELKHTVLATETVTMTSDDVAQPYAGLTLDMAGFTAGDVCTWTDLCYAILLPSSTEACQCAARILGTEAFVAAGNTGNTGMVRFVEMMNARAVALGMTNTTYFDAVGGSEVSGTIRNQISARDLSTICHQVFTNTALRPIAQAASYGIPITGANARTLSIVAFNRFTNGPTANQIGGADANVVGGKNGVWVINGETSTYNYTGIYTTPSGSEITITTLGSKSLLSMMFDQRGLMYAIPRDFPAFAATVGADTDFAKVKCLVGADGSIIDESSVARALTVGSATVGSPVIASTGSISLLNTGYTVIVPDASDIRCGSGDMTIETWFAGDGNLPSGEYIPFSKADNGTNNREWLLDLFSSAYQIFASADGATWSNTIGVTLSNDDSLCFHNGAIRHIALVKNGSTLSMYLNSELMANTLSIATLHAGPANLNIGGVTSATVTAPGLYDDFRATFGLARYTTPVLSLVGEKFSRSASPPPPPPPPPQVAGSGQRHKYHSPYNPGAYL